MISSIKQTILVPFAAIAILIVRYVGKIASQMKVWLVIFIGPTKQLLALALSSKRSAISGWSGNAKYFVVGLIAIFVGGFVNNSLLPALGVASGSVEGFIIGGVVILLVLGLMVNYFRASPDLIG